MSTVNRRSALAFAGRSLLAASLTGLLRRTGFGKHERLEDSEVWLTNLKRISQQLGDGKISGLQWQEAMDVVFEEVPLRGLLRYVDFDALSRGLSSRHLGVRGEVFVPIDIGVERRTGTGNYPEASRVLIAKVAHVRRGRSIPPHGHNNMVSAFLCISGRFDVRLYDKLDDREGEMIIRQTVEQKDAKPGSWSSISDYRNNVHWLTAKSEDCFLFTTKLIRLEKDREFRGRVNIDVTHATKLGSNTFCAAKITPREAAEKH